MRAIALSVAFLAVAACREHAPPEPAPPPASTSSSAASSATVRWSPARSPAGTPLLEAPAHVIPAPDGSAVISAPLRARVLDVKTQPGASVKKDEPLLDVLMPEAAAAAGAYLAASDEIAAHDKRAAQLEALQKEGLGRQSDVAAVQLELARLRGARDTAAATLRAAGLGVGGARALARSGGRTTLRAPIAGTVTAVHAVVGASRPSEEPLVEIVAGGATRVEARLSRPLPANAQVEFVAVGGAAIPAKFVASAPSREADGTARAWFELDAPAPSGASGRIRATLTATAAVLVPAAAVAREGTTTFVWRRDGDVSRRVPVEVLATSGADALVEGLAVGDQVAAVASAVEVR